MTLMIIAPVFPLVASDRGISHMEIGLVFASSPFFSFIFSLQMGKLLIWMGNRNVATLGLLLNAVSLIGLAFSNYLNNSLFLVFSLFARAVGGFGLACIYISSLRIIQRDFSSKKETYTSMMEAFGGLGLMSAPIYCTLTYQTIGYSGLFLLLSLPFLLFMPVYWCIVRPAPIGSEDEGFEEDLMMRFNRNLSIDFSMLVYGYIVLCFLEPVLSLYLVQHGIDETEVGLVFSGMTLLYTLTNFSMAWLANHVKLERFSFMGTVLCASSLALAGPFAAFLDVVWVSIAAVLLCGIGVAVGFSCILPNMIKEIKSGAITKGNIEVNSLYSIGMNTGEIIGPVISGILVDYLGFSLSCALVSLLGGLLLVLNFSLRKRRRLISQSLLEDNQGSPIKV
jgi:MFS family permease